MYKGERFNSITHLAGVILACVGVVLLLNIAVEKSDTYRIIGFGVYGVMQIVLYLTSTLYHSIRTEKVKNFLRQLDYLSIYLMIAGSYTPFTLITLKGPEGWFLFGIIWILAVIGIVQEIWIGKKTRKLSLFIYLLMGWLAVTALQPLVLSLSADGFRWLIAGGLSYTFGVIFFLLDEKYRHFHGYWHLCVLAGSFCHFMCLYLYVA